MNVVTLRTIYARIFDAFDRRDKRSGYVIGADGNLAPTNGALDADLKVAVAAGDYVRNAGTVANYAGGVIALGAAHATLPRRDIVYLDNAGVLAKTSGVAQAANPVPPAWPAGSVPIDIVEIPAGAANISLCVHVDVRQWGSIGMTTAEDIVKGGLSGAPTRVAVGANGTILTVTGGVVGWAAAAFVNPMTTSQDIIVGGAAGAPDRLAVGANGRILSVAAGVVGWGQGPLTTDGDLLVGQTAGTPIRLAMGAALRVLRVNAGATGLEWAATSSGVELISDQLLGADAANVDFTSIPATYKHLILVWQAKTTVGTVRMGIRFNNDSAGNYDSERLSAADTAVTAAAEIGATTGYATTIADDSQPGAVGQIIIPNYAAATFQKQYTNLSFSKSGETAAAQTVGIYGGGWRSTAAINRITLIPDSGNLFAGSRFSLFGVQ